MDHACQNKLPSGKKTLRNSTNPKYITNVIPKETMMVIGIALRFRGPKIHMRIGMKIRVAMVYPK
jgi:hypothetical protein